MRVGSKRMSELMSELTSEQTSKWPSTHISILGCFEPQVKGDVLKRGYVNKRGLAVTGWKRRWLTLTPGAIELHANETVAETALLSAQNNNNNNNNTTNNNSTPAKDVKTMRIQLQPESSVESLPAAHSRLGPFAAPHVFALKDVVVENPAKDAAASAKDNNNKKDAHPGGKKTNLELSVANFREKNEWMTAMRKSIEDRGRGNESVARKKFLKRRTKRRIVSKMVKE